MQIVAFMPTSRTRDTIWHYALTKTVLQREAFDQETAVDRTGASLRTVRETLTAMSETPFLTRKQEIDGTVRYTLGSAFR